MLAAVGCYLAFSYAAVYYSLVLEVTPGVYVYIIAPVLVLQLLAHQLIHLLPPQDLAFPFSPKLLYYALFRNSHIAALILLGVLWLLPWAVICVDTFMRFRQIDSVLLMMLAQQFALLGAALQLQEYLVICCQISSFRSIYVFLPSLLTIAFNLATITWLLLGKAHYQEMLNLVLLLATTGLLAIVLIALGIRTAIMPRGFRGYWEK